jgi:hypothetical protein
MKSSRNRGMLAAGAALLLVLLLFWFLRTPTQKPSQQPNPRPPSESSEAVRTTPAEPSSRPEASPTQKPGKDLLESFKALNDNPIEFYGRTVDQYGEPVASADVEASVMVNTGTTGGVRKARTTTDRQGYFSFTGLQGQDLTLVVKKPGYEFSARTKLFSYTYFEADHKRHLPDPRNPVVFVMWKKQGAEPLVHYEWRSWKFAADGSPLGVNLELGKAASADPDLIVRLRRADGPSNIPGYSWSAQIEVPKGGLILARDLDFYNLAPADGYISTFEFTQPSYEQIKALPKEEQKPWGAGAELMFWIKLRDGNQFGRVRLRLNAPNERLSDGRFESASFAVQAWINPSGSRNLEHDRTKEIRPPR